MGNYIKNRVLESGSTSVVIPSGTSAQRPDAPVFGQFRFNVTSAQLEFFNGSVFLPLSAAGAVSYAVDNFTGDGITTTFTMSIGAADTQQIMVFVGSIYQDPATAYTLSGFENIDINFTSAPGSGIPISVIHSST
jgi:hypothetical protein